MHRADDADTADIALGVRPDAFWSTDDIAAVSVLLEVSCFVVCVFFIIHSWKFLKAFCCMTFITDQHPFILLV